MEKTLKLVIMNNCLDFGRRVGKHINLIRETHSKYNLKIEEVIPIRFPSGESKIRLQDHCYGEDVYIMSDISNFDMPFSMRGITSCCPPAVHMMDLYAAIDAVKTAGAEYVCVIEPLLGDSRQHRDEDKESRNCRLGLILSAAAGADRIATYDVHDIKVQDAFHDGHSLKNMFDEDSIINKLVELNYDPNNLYILGPDEGAKNRCNIYGNAINTPVYTFEKERDKENVIDGQNRIKKHVYKGQPVDGKDILIVDDMIASGSSMIDTIKTLKRMGARRIFITASFPLFSDGISCVQKFSEAHDYGYFEKVITPDVITIPDYVLQQKWFTTVDCSQYVAKTIDQIQQEEQQKRLQFVRKRA